MRIRIAAVTNRGTVRAENQDAIAFSQHVLIGDDSGVIQDDIEFSELPKVCVLGDGMGGHAGGSEASKFAVEQLVRREGTITGKAEVVSLVEDIHKEICRKNGVGPGQWEQLFVE